MQEKYSYGLHFTMLNILDWFLEYCREVILSNEHCSRLHFIIMHYLKIFAAFLLLVLHEINAEIKRPRGVSLLSTFLPNCM